MRPYAILDVFTETPLVGNPLAVVFDADGLDPAAMQRIAAEFNLSETVFVLPAADPGHTAKVRIFTPKAELPFAGHPTVGTAVALAARQFGPVASDVDAVVVLEEAVGPVRCGVGVRAAGAHFAEFDLPRLPQARQTLTDRHRLARAIGLDDKEIGFENHAPSGFGAGNGFTFVPVRDLKTIARARPQAIEEVFAGGGDPSLFLYCRETEHTTSAFHARMFAPHMGIAEDPATGSAAAAFAGVIARFDEPRDGTHEFVIEQGFEMGRPSFIRLGIDIEHGRIHAARIGGAAVTVAEGTLNI